MARTGWIAVLLLLSGCAKNYEDAVRFYEEQPRFLRPVPYSPVPEGLPDLSAATCGKCHVEIYEEWRISTHARAWLDDAQFQEELAKSKKQGVAWMCVNCHTPMVNQLPQLVAGLEDGAVEKPILIDNPRFDPGMQNDAITCGTCHVRDGVILGPYGDTIAPHPVKKEPKLLEPAVCTDCHQAKMEWKHIALACMFDTGREYAASGYDEEGKTCQSCHMPEVVRPIATNGKPRKTRRHWFGGSLIPKKPEYTEEMAKLRKHYPPGLEASFVTVPTTAMPGSKVEVAYRFVNANAGHMLPSGDPERFIRIDIAAYAGDEKIASGREEIASKYQWSPEVKLLSDNRLKPRESRTKTFSFEAPKSGLVRVELRASRWRINEENLRYHDLQGRYVAGQEFLAKTATVAIQGAPRNSGQ